MQASTLPKTAGDALLLVAKVCVHSLALGCITLVALFSAARGESPAVPTTETRLEQLELEVAQLREENQRQQSELQQWKSEWSAQELFAAPVALPTVYTESSATNSDLAFPADDFEKLTSDISRLQLSVQRLETDLDQSISTPSISLLNKQWSVVFTGAMIGEMIFSEQRPIIPSAIVLLSPDFGNNTPTVDIHGKSSKVGALLRGPDFCGFQTGGAVLAYFFGEEFLADIAGINLIGGYGELKNENWRFIFGRAGDLINPRMPGTIDFNAGRNAGSLGFVRGQFRGERYFYPSANSKLSAQFSLCNPIATAYSGNPSNFVEDNGWPVFEGRVVLGVGPTSKRYGFETNRFELGTSGLIGQLRRTDIDAPTLIDVWAFGLDGKADLTERFGLRGEFFHGQALGNFNGGILQILNPITLQAVRTTGGWGSCYVKWSDQLGSNIGFGIDDPLNSTVAPGLPVQNSFGFANLIWDVTDYWEVGFEIARWKTDYQAAPALGADAPGDNEAMIYRTRVVLRF